MCRKSLGKYKLCQFCIDRLSIDSEKGVDEVSGNNCWLCEGLSQEIDELSEIVEEKLRDYEFSTFLIGSKIDDEIIEKEEKIVNELNLKDITPLKVWINSEIGKRISERMKKSVSFDNPDITAIIDTRFNHVELQISSLFLYGRYIKKVRGIPQTKWPCRVCRGKGCRRCNFTGKMYETSVEEIIAEKAIEAARGEDESFHGCGREDVDALMLGNGRPFVLEIKNPRIRSLNLKKLQEIINTHAEGKVEVRELRFSDKNEVRRLKRASFPKVYHAKIVAERELSEEKLKEVVRSLQGKNIKQLTPSRVAHRRAIKIRERKILDIKVIDVAEKNATLEIKAESGTYIKELVSGDEGRTKPSISEMLGIACKVEELDVIAIEGE
ncbi:MAG TPA: tRNA pseudouridine(54/55) synthase Pus10 [Thermoplasmatales archaeon]|nr:tRNA pseudouridine(54/55) synthase Pus10 [Thermoplasmatales archaeon]